ncbi:hypothetical protein M513_02183 [Trichuris suis]|uniref:Uncharacterized protein n=1 Tax=Trichuris suis TaxID=68888 RepID=A0A085MI80_9BILA|nr:hypothetical protein M513_02183 [Trichuris suis]
MHALLLLDFLQKAYKDEDCLNVPGKFLPFTALVMAKISFACRLKKIGAPVVLLLVKTFPWRCSVETSTRLGWVLLNGTEGLRALNHLLLFVAEVRGWLKLDDLLADVGSSICFSVITDCSAQKTASYVHRRRAEVVRVSSINPTSEIIHRRSLLIHTCQEQEEAVERLNEDKKRYLDELNLLPNAVSCFGKRNLTMSATEFLLVAADDGASLSEMARMLNGKSASKWICKPTRFTIDHQFRK